MAVENINVQESSGRFEEDFYRVYHKEFTMLLRTEITDLCAMCNHLLLASPEEISLNSGGVYRFVMECSRSEEILDQVYADQQPDWIYLRRLIAIIKHSCSITANLQYLSILGEKLTESVEGNFSMANQFVLKSFYHVLLDSAKNFLSETIRLGIIEQDYPYQHHSLQKYFIPDIKPLLRLKASSLCRASNNATESDAKKNGAKARETVLYLVSSLLHNCDVIDYLRHFQNVKTSKRKEIISDELHEETLTSQKELFHSSITFFDTQYSQRQIIVDAEVIDLINHIKVIYQLFGGFSTLMRIEERHYQFFIEENINFALNNDEIQGIIFDFFIRYLDRFRLQAEKICKHLISKYSEQKKVSLPIPSYRGFHVRPSTLVARIVMHYGSKVNMRLNDTSYNAAIPLDLFRANEVINAEKRREINRIIVEDNGCREYTKLLRKSSERNPVSMQKYFLELFQSLQKQEKIVVYGSLLADILEKPSLNEGFLGYVKREIAYLMVTGKIDIASNLSVIFEGDSRVLADIAILAEYGYGEDRAGNNTPLPKELSYLRR